jgi:hypothetical protein
MRANLPRAFGRRSPLMTVTLAVVFALMGAYSPAWAAPAAPTQDSSPFRGGGERGDPTAQGRPASSQPGNLASAEEQSYAAREASAKDLENFKGGDLVIIGSGGLVIVLLVVLLILLL